MSRRTAAPVRHILPDPKFNNDMLAKFMNVVMQSGKKSAAERIIYGAIDRIVEKTGKQGPDAVAMLTTALDNVKPVVEVKSRRVGGAARRWPCAGSSKPRVIAARSRWRSVSPMSSWTLRKTAAPPCASAKTRIAWPKPTRRSLTTAGNRTPR